MKILFICKYNRGRSKIAEAYLKKIKPEFNMKSAGVIKGDPISQALKNEGKKAGINITGTPRALDQKIIKWADRIIIVADNIPRKMFKEEIKEGKHIEQWLIRDINYHNNHERAGLIKRVCTAIDKHF